MITRLSIPAILSALGIAAMPLHAQIVETQGKIKTASFRDRNNLPPVAPKSVSKALSRKAPKNLAAPQGCRDPWFGSLTIGGTDVSIVIGRAVAAGDAEGDTESGSLPNKIYIDLNADGKLVKEEGMSITLRSRSGRGRTITQGQKTGLELTIAGAKLRADVNFLQIGDGAPRVTIHFPRYLQATAELEGKEMIIAVVDSNLNGRFGDPDDLWAVTKPGARPVSAYAMHALKEGHFADGTLTRIAVDGEKIKLTSAAAKGPDPMEQKAHRHRVEQLWFERFDGERENFIQQRNIDTSRPKAKAPIAWKSMTFEEGVALAKKTGKPLFVDVMAFWCVWCYRLDYYTYPDKEVATLLNEKFIPMKIIQEQDPAGDYAKVRELIGARGIPAMGIFDGNGKLVHKISGWKAPADFVKELEKAVGEKED